MAKHAFWVAIILIAMVNACLASAVQSPWAVAILAGSVLMVSWALLALYSLTRSHRLARRR